MSRHFADCGFKPQLRIWSRPDHRCFTTAQHSAYNQTENRVKPLPGILPALFSHWSDLSQLCSYWSSLAGINFLTKAAVVSPVITVHSEIFRGFLKLLLFQDGGHLAADMTGKLKTFKNRKNRRESCYVRTSDKW